jgi:hypothetical protein
MSPRTGLLFQVRTRSTWFLALMMPTKRRPGGTENDTSVPSGTLRDVP